VAAQGLKRISPVVDAYNIVSARYAYGIGAHDAARC
jgi:DNA/RNA-binding domain of Phe-tRNA-synthetase-like protein